MLYKFIIHHYLGACANHRGKRRTHCYGSPYLIYAPKWRRHQVSAFHIAIKSNNLSKNLGNGVFKIPRSKKVDLNKLDEKA